MKKLSLLLLLSTEVALGCQAMNLEQLKQKLGKEPAEELVFFASWCASCKKHLTEDRAAKSYFVAAFDEQPSALKAYAKFLGEKNLGRCIWDADGSIAEGYQVKALPALVKLPANGK